MSKKPNILDVILETARGFHEIGLIDHNTMHEFEELQLKPIKDLSAKEIKDMRRKEKVSQPVLAQMLNVSPSTIKRWEKGDHHPTGAALRLLNLIQEKGTDLFHP